MGMGYVEGLWMREWEWVYEWWAGKWDGINSFLVSKYPVLREGGKQCTS